MNPLNNGTADMSIKQQATAPNINQQLAGMINGLKGMGIDPRQIQTMMRNGANPQMIFGLMSKKYPQAAGQLQQIQQLMQGGNSLQNVAMGVMQARGIDPNGINPQEIMKLVNGN